MKSIGTPKILAILIIAAFITVPASSAVTATIGETVVLSGSGGGYDEMYLFLTGPNLAPGGVRLDGISSAVVSGDTSTFTRTTVDGGRWEYSWDTGTAGGTLDAGTYLVWATPVPMDRYDLTASGENYATIGVTLNVPALIATIVTDPTGSVHVTSDPAGALVTVNAVPYGETPLVIGDLAGGPVKVNVSKAGYFPHEEDIVIRTGTMAVLDVALTAEGVAPTATVPSDGSPTTPPAPASDPTPIPAPLCGVAAGLVFGTVVTGIRGKYVRK